MQSPSSHVKPSKRNKKQNSPVDKSKKPPTKKKVAKKETAISLKPCRRVRSVAKNAAKEIIPAAKKKPTKTFTLDFMHRLQSGKLVPVWRIAHSNKALSKKFKKIVYGSHLGELVVEILREQFSLRHLAYLMHGMAKIFHQQASQFEIDARQIYNAVVQYSQSIDQCGTDMKRITIATHPSLAGIATNHLLALNDRADIFGDGLDLDQSQLNHLIRSMTGHDNSHTGRKKDITMVEGNIVAQGRHDVHASDYDVDQDDFGGHVMDISIIENVGSENEIDIPSSSPCEDDKACAEEFPLHSSSDQNGLNSCLDDAQSNDHRTPSPAARKKARRTRTRLNRNDAITELDANELRRILDNPNTTLTDAYGIRHQTSRRIQQQLLYTPHRLLNQPSGFSADANPVFAMLLEQLNNLDEITLASAIPDVEVGRGVNGAQNVMENIDLEQSQSVEQQNKEFVGDIDDLEVIEMPAEDGLDALEGASEEDHENAASFISEPLSDRSTISPAFVEQMLLTAVKSATDGCVDFTALVKMRFQFNRRGAARAFHGLLKLAMMKRVDIHQDVPYGPVRASPSCRTSSSSPF